MKTNPLKILQMFCKRKLMTQPAPLNQRQLSQKVARRNLQYRDACEKSREHSKLTKPSKTTNLYKAQTAVVMMENVAAKQETQMMRTTQSAKSLKE